MSTISNNSINDSSNSLNDVKVDSTLAKSKRSLKPHPYSSQAKIYEMVNAKMQKIGNNNAKNSSKGKAKIEFTATSQVSDVESITQQDKQKIENVVKEWFG